MYRYMNVLKSTVGVQLVRQYLEARVSQCIS